MSSFLITFKPISENPKLGWAVDELKKLITRLNSDSGVVEYWRFHNRKEAKPGDPVFLLMQGKRGPAIIGYGQIAGKHKLSHGRWVAPIKFTKLVDPDQSLLADRDRLKPLINLQPNVWRTQASGVKLDERLANRLKKLCVDGRRPPTGRLMRKLDHIPIEIPRWPGASSPFSKGTNPQFYRPSELKDVGEGKTPRTTFFEQTLVGLYWKLKRPVPYAFTIANGETRSLDAGCLKFLLNRKEPEIDVKLDDQGYIISVIPLSSLLRRYDRMRTAIEKRFPISLEPKGPHETDATALLSVAVLETAFDQKGFAKHRTEKLLRFTHPLSVHSLYLKLPEEGRSHIRRPLVMHPRTAKVIIKGPGLIMDDEFYHDSHLRDFPVRKHTGKKLQHYGLAFDVCDQTALDNLIAGLLDGHNFDGRDARILADFDGAREQLNDLAVTERDAIVKARLGQGQFRVDLFAYWRGCAITDARIPEVLRASHIKPWRDSDNRERLDKFNGLLLTANLDRVFDAGLISFDDHGVIIVSPLLSQVEAKKLGIVDGLKLRQLHASHRPYLLWHRKHEFRDGARNKL